MKNTMIALSCLLLLSCVPLTPPSTGGSRGSVSKKLLYEDYNYEAKIKTVQLTPQGNTLLPAVIRAGDRGLRLVFDDLSELADTYRVKFINCDKNWKPSGLNSLEYLSDYNEFNITDYEFSFDTTTPYIHYTFDVPAIKRSGNYLLVVYRVDNVDDFILSKRMLVVQQSVDIASTASLMGLSNLSAFNQQINFTINYPNYQIDNPLANLDVVLRQNQRNDNSISGLKPSFTREDIQQLEYRFFDHQNTFSAANEFRFFDLRSLIYPGQNVQSVNLSTSPPKTLIALDKPKTNLAYAQYNDNNGQFLIDDHLNVNGQYTEVTFQLETKRIGYAGAVYVFGEFTDWKLSDAYRMKYNSEQERYEKPVLLKQGYYEYQYLIKSDSLPHYIEGNHPQAENSYEILVYYKPLNERSDLLIGYYTTNRGVSNP
jgi:hypothetical protein